MDGRSQPPRRKDWLLVPCPLAGPPARGTLSCARRRDGGWVVGLPSPSPSPTQTRALPARRASALRGVLAPHLCNDCSTQFSFPIPSFLPAVSPPAVCTCSGVRRVPAYGKGLMRVSSAGDRDVEGGSTVTRILVMVMLRVLGCLLSLSCTRWRTHECSPCSPHMFSPRHPRAQPTARQGCAHSASTAVRSTLGKNPDRLLLAVSHRPVLRAEVRAGRALPCTGLSVLAPPPCLVVMVTLHFTAGCLPGRNDNGPGRFCCHEIITGENWTRRRLLTLSSV